MTLSIGAGFARPWVRHSVVERFAQDAAKRHARTAERMAEVRDAVRPSAALAAAYRARLLRLIDEMNRSIVYWLERAYRGQDEKIALISGDGMAYDATAANVLDDLMRRLRRRWLRRFSDMAKQLAEYFATEAGQRSDEQLKRILKRGGMAVEFKLTPAVREVLGAIVKENVALIKSIPEQYLGQVEGAVMRSVSAGRDLASLTKELRERHGVTRRRAELIARDQNNKASGAITRIRYAALGIERGIWLHSGGGRKPRPSHVANSGKEYSIKDGWLDPKEGKRIFPGQLPNCRCVVKPIIPDLRDAISNGSKKSLSRGISGSKPGTSQAPETRSLSKASGSDVRGSKTKRAF